MMLTTTDTRRKRNAVDDGDANDDNSESKSEEKRRTVVVMLTMTRVRWWWWWWWRRRRRWWWWCWWWWWSGQWETEEMDKQDLGWREIIRITLKKRVKPRLRLATARLSLHLFYTMKYNYQERRRVYPDCWIHITQVFIVTQNVLPFTDAL